MNSFITGASVHGPIDGAIRDDIPQFAFAGRSNVGKSSLLNALMRQKLARTSAAAGKTRQANYFQVTMDGGLGHPGQWRAYLVDLPGYGYARGGDVSVAELASVNDAYFATRVRAIEAATARGERAPGGIFLLVDARHPGLAADLEAHRWLSLNVEPPHVIATKVDKLSRSERQRHLREFAGIFGAPPLAVSSDKGEGLEDLRRLMARLVRDLQR